MKATRKRKTKLVRIIERHLEAMLDELRENGIRTAGIAGGIMLCTKPRAKTSTCHTFTLADPTFTLRDGAPMTIKGLVTDIAGSLLRLHGPPTSNTSNVTKH